MKMIINIILDDELKITYENCLQNNYYSNASSYFISRK